MLDGVFASSNNYSLRKDHKEAKLYKDDEFILLQEIYQLFQQGIVKDKRYAETQTRSFPG